MGPRIKWTEERILRMQGEGIGKGTVGTYQPWIRADKTSSLGRARRIWSHKTGRTHHLLSDVEYNLFLGLEWQQDIIDIREQFPLDRDITQEIAQKLGIKHPYYPGTQVPTVMTVDFLVTKQVGVEKTLLAFNAKRDDEANDARSLSKLEIQRTYFEELCVPHYVVFDSQIPLQKITNIDWIREALIKVGEVELRPGYFATLSGRMATELTHTSRERITLVQYCASFDQRYGCEQGTGLRVARMLMQSRVLKANLSSPDLCSEPLSDFVMTAPIGQLRALGGK